MYRGFEVVDCDLYKAIVDVILKDHEEFFKILIARCDKYDIIKHIKIIVDKCDVRIMIAIGYVYFDMYYDSINKLIHTGVGDNLYPGIFAEYDELLSNIINFTDCHVSYSSACMTGLHKILPAIYDRGCAFKLSSIDKIVATLKKCKLYQIPFQKSAIE